MEPLTAAMFREESESDPAPEAVPHEEGPYFTNKGPGVFADRFPVGGTLFAVVG